MEKGRHSLLLRWDSMKQKPKMPVNNLEARIPQASGVGASKI